MASLPKTPHRRVLFALCCLGILLIFTGCRQAVAPTEPGLFRVSAIDYADAQYSYLPTPEQAPLYSLASDGTLYEIQNETKILSLGKAEPLSLQKENFDALFSFPELCEEEVGALRKNSRRAFALQDDSAGFANTDSYIWTEQNDGSVYLACGYAATDGTKAHIRFVYRLKALTEEEISALWCTIDPGCMDAALLDLDGDGTKELCTLRSGRTSGLFSFSLCARKDGKLDGPYLYNTTFLSEAGSLSFFIKDGAAVVRLSPQAAPDTPIDYTVSVADGAVSLHAGGNSLQALPLSDTD